MESIRVALADQLDRGKFFLGSVISKEIKGKKPKPTAAPTPVLAVTPKNPSNSNDKHNNDKHNNDKHGGGGGRKPFFRVRR